MISVLYNICSIIPVSSLLSALHDPSDGDNTAVRRRRDLNAGPLRTGVDDLAVADVDAHMSAIVNNISGLGLRVRYRSSCS